MIKTRQRFFTREIPYAEISCQCEIGSTCNSTLTINIEPNEKFSIMMKHHTMIIDRTTTQQLIDDIAMLLAETSRD